MSERRSYHRDESYNSSAVVRSLLREFNISPLEHSQEYLPIAQLGNTSIEPLLESLPPELRSQIRLLRDDKHRLAILILPEFSYSDAKENFETIWLLKKKIRAMGLIASPWEIAENVQMARFEPKQTVAISLDPSLPGTRDALLQIASSERYPTHHLAACLKNMLNNLPAMPPQSIQRMALMLDMSSTFYAHNYPRYAFCVYAIVHEISLALAREKDPAHLEHAFNAFQNEAQTTFLQQFGLSSVPEQTQVVSMPANTGTQEEGWLFMRRRNRALRPFKPCERVFVSYVMMIRKHRAGHEQVLVCSGERRIGNLACDQGLLTWCCIWLIRCVGDLRLFTFFCLKKAFFLRISDNFNVNFLPPYQHSIVGYRILECVIKTCFIVC